MTPDSCIACSASSRTRTCWSTRRSALRGGFVLEQALRLYPEHAAYFWATHQGAEIDLVLKRGGELVGVEFKRADAPRLTRSIRIAMNDLGLDRVLVVYPGSRRYALAERVEAIPLSALAEGRPL